MDVMVLNRPLKSIHPLYSSNGDQTQSEQDHEISLIFGDDMDGGTRDRELQAYVGRIKILESELQKARAEAYQAGYNEGSNLVKTEARKQISQLTCEFSDNLHSMHNEFGEAIEKLSAPLLKLAMRTAEKLIDRELSLGDSANEILLMQVQRILNEAVSQSRATVHVNTSQSEWISSVEILKMLNVPQKKNLRFIPNPTIKPGECKLETEDYLVDSTIKSQLDNLERALIESDAADN